MNANTASKTSRNALDERIKGLLRTGPGLQGCEVRLRTGTGTACGKRVWVLGWVLYWTFVAIIKVLRGSTEMIECAWKAREQGTESAVDSGTSRADRSHQGGTWAMAGLLAENWKKCRDHWHRPCMPTTILDHQREPRSCGLSPWVWYKTA